MKKSALMFLIFALALALWIPAQIKLAQTRRALRASEMRLAALHPRLAEAETALVSARNNQAAQNHACVEAAAALDAARRDLAKRDPESRWANPPASLPDWDPESPYIWIPKDFLPQMRSPVFAKNGDLSRDAADVLAVDDPTRRDINQQIEAALNDFHSQQVSSAQITNSQDGQTVTVQIPSTPQEGTALVNDITQIFQQNLGEQRAGLITNAASDWLSGISSSRAMVVSVTRAPDGKYQINMQLPDGSSYSCGPVSADYAKALIPDYVVPLLNDILPSSDETP